MMDAWPKCELRAASRMLVFCVLLLCAMLLVSCSRGRKLPGPVPVDLGQTPQDQQPTNGKTGAGEIIFDSQGFELSMLISDVDAARKDGAVKDTAVVTSVTELLAVDFISEDEIEVVSTPLSINSYEVWAEDFNGDGVDDVLVGGAGLTWRDDSVSLVVQSGGEFQEEETAFPFEEVTALFPFKLDHYDDIIDIVSIDKLSGEMVGLLSASGDLPPIGFSAVVSSGENDVYCTGAAKADMDGNGREDAVLAVYGEVTYYGDTLFAIHFGYEGVLEPEGDDWADPRMLNPAITTGKDNYVIPDESTATKDPDVLNAIEQGTIVLSPYRVALGDFDGDQLPDVALLCKALEGEMDYDIGGMVYHCNSFLVVQVNDGVPEGADGIKVTFTLSQASIIGPWGEDIGAADFDQDGNLDLVLSVSSAKAIATARGLGDGTFEDFEYLSLGEYHPYRIAIGEFDDTEGIDAVMTCPMEQRLIFFLNGSETATPPVG